MKIITIAGNVTKDAELRRGQNGDPLASFSVAVDDGYGDKKTSMFFDVTVYGKRGQSLQPHITKGTKLTVIGELGKREYEGKTYLTVRASEVALQGGAPAKERAPAKQERTTTSYDDMNDDLPF